MAFSSILNLLFYFSILFSSTISITNITSDQSALLQFKNNIIDPRGFLEDWTPKKPICNWTGVTCNPVHLRVKTLDISDMTLTGTIHPDFGNLTFLVFLNISNNYLSGNLPKELVHLRRLRTLDLSSNNFIGSIPLFLGSMLKLETLFLSNNTFGGSLPPILFNLTNLRDLRMRNISIEGEIPQEIGNLKKLIFLDLQYNQLSGFIPRSIYNMSSLEIIALSLNNLSGNIPSDLCHHLQRLRGIYLGENQFYGGIPTSLPDCSKLEVLSMGFNKLTGSIPNYIGNLTVLRTFQLQENNLSGKLPEDIGNLKQLELLALYNNSFSGVVPESISNCSQLLRISFYGNQFINTGDSTLAELSLISYLANFRQLQFIDVSENPLHGFLPKSFGNFSASLDKFSAENCEINGIIPDEIGNLSSLIHLDLGGNNLNGKIPSEIKGLENLQRLYLDRNILTGSIPDSICNLPILGFLDLSSNKLTGEIPACVGTISSLRYLALYNNLLEGNIPLSFGGMKDLLALSLAWNKLDGSLPVEVGNMKALFEINLSGNMFSGNLPSSLGNLESLQGLALRGNSFEGHIPESISKMISLEDVDLSSNSQSGAIPDSLTKLLHLVSFNVSFNKLVGEIPSGGPFVNFSANYFESNEALCGDNRYGVPPCVANSSKGSKRNTIPWWVFVIIGVASVIILLALAILFRKCKRPRKVQVVEIVDAFLTTRRISYYELLQATEAFSTSNLLGKGSFGSVYKGVMNDGMSVAVKVFNLQVRGAFESFDVECEVLRTLRHRNLTKVISSCSTGDSFKALVLEYMPNGSLDEWLHSGRGFLNVLQRLNIMIDVAHALEYLHYGFSSPVVHCDIKPSNVLLDDTMTGRLSDFGLTRFLNDEASFTHTNTLATLGYIAPEFGVQGLVSRATDIYSFGILLMETFTKKKPCDEEFTGNLSLREWIYNCFHQSQLVKVLDTDLLGFYGSKVNQEIQVMTNILEVALNCCEESVKDRMNIRYVCIALEKIKHSM